MLSHLDVIQYKPLFTEKIYEILLYRQQDIHVREFIFPSSYYWNQINWDFSP